MLEIIAIFIIFSTPVQYSRKFQNAPFVTIQNSSVKVFRLTVGNSENSPTLSDWSETFEVSCPAESSEPDNEEKKRVKQGNKQKKKKA